MQRLRRVTTLLRIGIPTNWQVSYTLHAAYTSPVLYTLSYTDDATQVRLRSNGVQGSDYINANFIDVSTRYKECMEACHLLLSLFKCRATESAMPT